MSEYLWGIFSSWREEEVGIALMVLFSKT
jgi:hypothetical protein